MKKTRDPLLESEEYTRGLVHLFLEDPIAYECFILRSYERMTHLEISERLKISQNWANRSYLRAKKILQDYLQVHTVKLITEVVREIVNETVREEERELSSMFPPANRGMFQKRKVG